jgi:hypothetical protein
MYKKVAPILRPSTTAIVPIHFPKIKPPIKATGEPKPKNGNTHKIVKSKKIKKIRIKLEFFNSKKYDRLFLIKSYEVSS